MEENKNHFKRKNSSVKVSKGSTKHNKVQYQQSLKEESSFVCKEHNLCNRMCKHHQNQKFYRGGYAINKDQSSKYNQDSIKSKDHLLHKVRNDRKRERKRLLRF